MQPRELLVKMTFSASYQLCLEHIGYPIQYFYKSQSAVYQCYRYRRNNYSYCIFKMAHNHFLRIVFSHSVAATLLWASQRTEPNAKSLLLCSGIPESLVAQVLSGEPFHYFANYPYNCPAEICQHCPNCYNNQPKRLLKRVHIQWIHFRFLQIVFLCTAQLIFVPRKFSAHRNHVLCVKFAHVKNSSIYFSASSYHNVIIPSTVFRHAKSRRADCRRISCRNIFISRSVMPRSGRGGGASAAAPN